MRYSLLSKACQKNDIGYLLTAHHQGDQLETVNIISFILFYS